MRSPGRSRILCLSCAWSRGLRFHRKPASTPSSAGSESSMVPLRVPCILELPPASPSVPRSLPTPTVSSQGAPPPPPVRHFPPPRAPTQRPASASEPRATLTTVFCSTRGCCSTQRLALPTQYQVDECVCVTQVHRNIASLPSFILRAVRQRKDNQNP